MFRLLKNATRPLPLTVALLASLLLLAAPAYAQTTVTDDQVNEVAKEMFCPTCENTPLDVCPTQTCQDWRDLIREKLAAGESKEEIKNYFASRYGDHVLAEPPRTGFDLIVWALPVLAVVGGAFLFARFVAGLRRTAQAVPDAMAASAPPSDPAMPASSAGPPADYLARIEQELKESS